MTRQGKRRGNPPPVAPAWGRLSLAVADMNMFYSRDEAERAAARYRELPRFARFDVEVRQATSGAWFIAGRLKEEPS